MVEYEIVFYEKENGECPIEEFLDSVDGKLAAKITSDMEILANAGPALREPRSKELEDGIFELRTKLGSNISRVLYFFVIGKRIVLTNGFIKKTPKTPKAEKDKAKRYREDYLRRWKQSDENS